MNMDFFNDFLLCPAPDPVAGEEDVWFDIMSVGSEIAGIGQRIQSSGNSSSLNSNEILLLNQKYLINNYWVCHSDNKKMISLREDTELYFYASLIQRVCNQLKSEL